MLGAELPQSIGYLPLFQQGFQSSILLVEGIHHLIGELIFHGFHGHFEVGATGMKLLLMRVQCAVNFTNRLLCILNRV